VSANWFSSTDVKKSILISHGILRSLYIFPLSAVLSAPGRQVFISTHAHGACADMGQLRDILPHAIDVSHTTYNRRFF
jgi:hypothetical protein